MANLDAVGNPVRLHDTNAHRLSSAHLAANNLGGQTVTYFTLAQLLSAAIVILFVGGLYKALGGKWFAPEPKPKEPNQDSRFKLLPKLFSIWIAFGALVLLILVISLAFVLWAIV